MRTLAALLMVALIIIPIQASAANGGMWEDAREGILGGTLGGISLSLSGNTTDSSISMDVIDLPTVIEVYTATWCTSCVTTEHTLDEAIGDADVTRIHYHRHKFEVEDPFGSNGTEERWESIYGTASTSVGGAPRLAPTTVFDGERLHLGTTSKSDSLQSDFSASLAIGPSHVYDGSMSLSAIESEGVTEFSWDITTMIYNCAGDCPIETRTAWLLFVEGSASFPDGSNGIGDYIHVLHDAVPLDGPIGSTVIDVPPAWDGDDMSAVLLVDWSLEPSPPEPGIVGKIIPAPSVAILVCMLAALVPRRRSTILH
jgi:thiol-disulfide isomerase/thioredoxin